ncbi:unnamed protein product [Lactuca virosa]|uniref:Uncharacterized protein n=1 Tax=Lactuca virosa TaxID=75947 RepID=A0AAU9M776_9ASTR|nr:unnamed protein product [Lactuca virosa]
MAYKSINHITLLYHIHLHYQSENQTTKTTPKRMKPAEMESIIQMLIGQAEEEVTALTNLQSDFFFHKEMKNEVLENMSRCPKYTNYLQMKDILTSSTYDASKRIQAIYKLQKETEATINDL